jgi:hypothetical protein
MTPSSNSCCQPLYLEGSRSSTRLGATLVWGMLIWMVMACTHLPAPSMPRDPVAEQIIATLKQTNIDLIRFKCMGKITISNPKQPVQTYRSAIAGQLNDHLRIDMFAPFGGAAGTVASDGEHLFLVLHASRKYYKKRFADGSLRRFIKINLTVGDLLELLVGRIPLEDELIPRMMPAEDTEGRGVRLVDRKGKIHQEIVLDADGRLRRAQWFDDHHHQVLSLKIDGAQVSDGFVVPKRIALVDASGNTVSVTLSRYEANAMLNQHLFVPPPISS